MKTFLVSDTHFYHKNIQKFCPTTRPGKDYIEMSEMMIYNWNSQVRKTDLVYHLGDFSFGSYTETADTLRRLNGRIILVKGNHDQMVLKPEQRTRFERIEPYLETKINGIDVVMFHYPIKEWNKMHRGSYHCYGHVHNKDIGLNDRRAMDVGIDARPNGDMMLWDFDEIHEILVKRPIMTHHDAEREMI
jgi:calcineurin-like phosphoesterase family protein